MQNRRDSFAQAQYKPSLRSEWRLRPRKGKIAKECYEDLKMMFRKCVGVRFLAGLKGLLIMLQSAGKCFAVLVANQTGNLAFWRRPSLRLGTCRQTRILSMQNDLFYGFLAVSPCTSLTTIVSHERR